MDIKYPEIEVQLTGQDSNALNLIGLVKNALRDAGVEQDEISEFITEATSGNHDHVIQTCMKWVEVS